MLRLFRRITALSCLVLMTTAVVGSDRDSQAGLSPNQDYSGQRRSPVEYRIDFSVVVTAPHHSHVLKVWLPLPQDNACQAIRDRRLSTFPMHVEPRIGREPRYGNQFAYFEFHEPKGAQLIRHQFRAKVWEMRWNLNADKVINVEKWPPQCAPYLQPDTLTRDPSFHAVVNQLAKPKSTSGDRMIAANGWGDQHRTYVHNNASLQPDARHASTLGSVTCSDYNGH